jgi:VacB/RNase II family 3'-5' exoribonuclease
MLDRNAMAQLKGLKHQMEVEKERAEAVIKGTQARYGFAVLDDGREVFVPPDEMLKAFPDDRVRICIRPSNDKRSVAEIEKLLDSPLDQFAGRCVRKGKALFVQPDLSRLKRWLFIPPHARNGVREGDYVLAGVLRHPIRDGRPQAKILKVIGSEDTPGLENQYVMAKYGLPQHWPAAAEKELEQVLSGADPKGSSQRLDLTDLEFISIDSARTQDIDDALFAESSSSGWTLYVAVADPTAYIEAGSGLEKEIEQRATSLYFHGDVVPMLPESLAQATCALAEGEARPALVCKITVGAEGELESYEFHEAVIRSRAKLSYYAVDRFLSGQHDDLMSHAAPLEPLYQVYRVLRARREAAELVMEDRQEYRWILGEDRQIESIEPSEKMASQRLVEECMIAANRCAAELLREHAATGPFVCHPGFRGDRLDELRAFLEMHAPELADEDASTIEGYQRIMQGLANSSSPLPLRAMVNRLMTRASLATVPGPHMGMAIATYTNFTSPLRKYLDFLVHRQIREILHEHGPNRVDQPCLDRLAARLTNARSALTEAERWLSLRYLQRLAAGGETSWQGRVSHINSSGFMVKLDANGIEGFVDLRKDPEKFSFDKWQASLTSTTRRFQLDQPVTVSLLGEDPETPHLALFAPAEGCGLKPPKQESTAAASEAAADQTADAGEAASVDPRADQ